MPSIDTENGSVTPAMALSPLSVVKPLMSSGLCAVEACNAIAPSGSACTDQPSSGRLSSRILPLKVSGNAVAPAPPAPWKPMVAAWPFAMCPELP